MKVAVLPLLFLISAALGSDIASTTSDAVIVTSNAVNADVTASDSVIESITAKDPIEDELDFDPEEPEFIKQRFIFSIINGDVDQSRLYVEKYSYLTDKFNRDVFEGLIKCFNDPFKQQECWSIFELITPSFGDVSHSTSTPLILAIRRNRNILVNELVKLEAVKNTVDQVDEFDRTALMYAAKRGNLFAVKMILNLSTGSINAKDFLGKTALHYACEMNSKEETVGFSFKLPSALTGEIDPTTELKFAIATMLIGNGAEIFADGPEYKLKSGDGVLKTLLEMKKGKVVVEENVQDLVVKVATRTAMLKTMHLLQMNGLFKHIASNLVYLLLANPIFALLNEACYHVQQFLLPGVDMNVNLSFDLGESIQDYSFNVLFVMLMVPVLMKISEEFKKADELKF